MPLKLKLDNPTTAHVWTIFLPAASVGHSENSPEHLMTLPRTFKLKTKKISQIATTCSHLKML